MTSLTGKMMMITAAMTVVAGVASAERLKADIPFPFRASGVVLPAGSYEVSTNRSGGGSAYVVVANSQTKKSVIMISQGAVGYEDTSAAKLVFDCSAGRCALTQLYNGQGGSNHRFARPSIGRDELSRVVEVPLHRVAD